MVWWIGRCISGWLVQVFLGQQIFELRSSAQNHELLVFVQPLAVSEAFIHGFAQEVDGLLLLACLGIGLRQVVVQGYTLLTAAGGLDHGGLAGSKHVAVEGERFAVLLLPLGVFLLGKVGRAQVAVNNRIFGSVFESLLVEVLGLPYVVLGVVHGGQVV